MPQGICNRESPAQFENRTKPRVYVRHITRTNVVLWKSSILLAGTGVRKINSVACGFSPIKPIFIITQKNVISRINEVMYFSIKYRYTIFYRKKNIKFIYNRLLAHLSRRLMGELIVYQSFRRPSVVCRPSVRPQFHTSSPLKPLGQTNSNFIWRILGHGNESLFKWSWSHDQDGRHAHIW